MWKLRWTVIQHNTASESHKPQKSLYVLFSTVLGYASDYQKACSEHEAVILLFAAFFLTAFPEEVTEV